MPWRRVGAEALVIVVSILLALAADAWWDGVQGQRDQTTLNEALREDLEATRAALGNNVIGDLYSYRERVTTLLNAVDTLERIPTDSLRGLAAAATRLVFWEPTIVGYGDAGWSQSLVGSQNVELQRALGDFARAQRMDQRYVEQFTSMYFQGELAALGRSLGSIYTLGGPTARGGAPARFELSDTDYRAFLRRRDVYSTLELVHTLHANRISQLEALDRAAARAIDALAVVR